MYRGATRCKQHCHLTDRFSGTALSLDTCNQCRCWSNSCINQAGCVEYAHAYVPWPCTSPQLAIYQRTAAPSNERATYNGTNPRNAQTPYLGTYNCSARARDLMANGNVQRFQTGTSKSKQAACRRRCMACKAALWLRTCAISL
jgi:hypothetical protein